MLGRFETGAPPAGRLFWQRLPLTAGLVLVTIVAGAVSGALGADFHHSVEAAAGWDLAALRNWELYRLWAGLPFGSLPGIRPTMVLLLALGPGVLEWRRGTRTAAVTFFLLGPAVSLITTLSLWPAYARGVGAIGRFLLTPDLGSSTASLACWGVAVGSVDGAGSPWLAALTVAVLGALWIVRPAPYVVDHFAAFIVAFGLGRLVRATANRRSGCRWRVVCRLGKPD